MDFLCPVSDAVKLLLNALCGRFSPRYLIAPALQSLISIYLRDLFFLSNHFAGEAFSSARTKFVFVRYYEIPIIHHDQEKLCCARCSTNSVTLIFKRDLFKAER